MCKVAPYGSVQIVYSMGQKESVTQEIALLSFRQLASRLFRNNFVCLLAGFHLPHTLELLAFAVLLSYYLRTRDDVHD